MHINQIIEFKTMINLNATASSQRYQRTRKIQSCKRITNKFLAQLFKIAPTVILNAIA